MVTAPVEAEETSRAYFSSAPRGAGRDGGTKAARRSASLASVPMRRVSVSMVIVSPSRTRAIGPPTAASGATWPMTKPWLAPEKRPSVIRATSLSSRPLSAAVTASISRMPGPPLPRPPRSG